MAENSEKTVSDYWSKMVKDKPTMLSWSDSPIVMQHINKCITGDIGKGWLQYAVEKYVKKNGVGVDNILSIGCGSGALERQCIGMNACVQMDAFDIAVGAISECKRIANEEKISNIEYSVKNIEIESIPLSKYNVVFASSSIHHIKNLEDSFKKIYDSLKPDGVFIMLEYIGPSQFQFPEKTITLINKILQLLPDKYKKTSSGNLKESYQKPTIEYMNKIDPSESIRSSDIIPSLSKYFNIIEKNDYGGTILHMLLQEIISNFNHDDVHDVALLDMLIFLETLLIKEKVLNSDFAFIVAKPK
jgi:ubiquinone/menaquinone biosynthesis C-methylase UbiE